MKTRILALLLFIISGNIKATTVVISVQDFLFSPATVTIATGDTIVWLWDSGTHTTTSTTIPAGAAPWNQQIDQAHMMYIYVPTVAGSYDYECIYHASMGMTGHITVLPFTTSIEDLHQPLMNVIQVVNGKEINVRITMPVSGIVRLTMYDIIGKAVRTETMFVTQGNTDHSMDISSMHDGIYIVEAAMNATKVSRKILLR